MICFCDKYCIKMSKFGVFYGQYFSVFTQNSSIYKENFRIQSEYRKIRTKKAPNSNTLFKQQNALHNPTGV